MPLRNVLVCLVLFLFVWIGAMVYFLAPQTLTATFPAQPPRTAIITPIVAVLPTSTFTAPDPRFMILNLRRRDDRWRCVSKEFQKHGIQPTRIEAVDAKIKFAPDVRRNVISGLKELSSAQKAALVDDTGINTGHLATFLTHISALRAIVDQNLDFGCIFEDDIALVDHFLERVNEMMVELPSDWDLLILSMYCHDGWSSCKLNHALRPISPHLRPVLAFMSGAGYCLNAKSAQRVLNTIPCTRGPCGVAIDGYLSGMAQSRSIVAYRAVTLPVIIPQDMMKQGQHDGTRIQVQDKDCYSRFDSDIALWWKPDQSRTGQTCIVVSNNDKGGGKIKIAARGEILLDEQHQHPFNVQVKEHETMEIYSVQQLFFSWKVRNIENTVYVHGNAGCIVIVSNDLWRGMSVTFHNVGRHENSNSAIAMVQDVDVWWNEGNKNGEGGRGNSVGGWIQSTLLRGAPEKNLPKPIKHGTIRLGDSFHIFVPDFKRSLIVVPKDELWVVDGGHGGGGGGGHFENVLLIQSLSVRCKKNAPVAAFQKDPLSFVCGKGYQKLMQTDIRGHDQTLHGGIFAESLSACCHHCTTTGGTCGGVIYRSDMDINCYLKDSTLNVDRDRVIVPAATMCVRESSGYRG